MTTIYGQPRYDNERVYGPTWAERRAETIQQQREYCMSGEVMAAPDMNQKLKEFVELHLQHRKDADDIVKHLDATAGTNIFVRVDGQLYTLTKNYGASYELPVNIHKAVVIE